MILSSSGWRFFGWVNDFWAILGDFEQFEVDLGQIRDNFRTIQSDFRVNLDDF